MYSPQLALLIALILIGVAALVFWPQKGLLHRWRRARRMTEQVLREDALKSIHRAERMGRQATLQSVAGDLHVSVNRASEVLAEMEALELVETRDGDFTLTAEGRSTALHVIRAHRLWERYLADETGYAESEWHTQADQLEHTVGLEEIDALSAQLGNPTYDPHGDPIPTAAGEMRTHGGRPLSGMEPGTVGRIVHLEDEPEVIYAQLAALGLHPGQDVRLIERTTQRVRFWADGDEHILAPILAANISVVPLTFARTPVVELESGERLSVLRPGETAEVVQVSRSIRSSERRRLMDLGIVPGTHIEAAFRSPSGDTMAYLIRDTLIALRSEQANYIGINREPNAFVRETEDLATTIELTHTNNGN
ncbi:MAG: DtxR family transcriptional regulator [Caldilineales bacterium]|nr:DtxR family transcriptional regulator [Caldilineales bacterium]